MKTILKIIFNFIMFILSAVIISKIRTRKSKNSEDEVSKVMWKIYEDVWYGLAKSFLNNMVYRR